MMKKKGKVCLYRSKNYKRLLFKLKDEPVAPF